MLIVHQYSWVDKHRHIWLPIIQVIANTNRSQFRFASEHSEGICVVPPTRNSFGDRSFSAAVLVCGTPWCHICDRTWTTDISSSHWKDSRLGCRRPRRIVTLVFVHFRSFLLTYLHFRNYLDHKDQAGVIVGDGNLEERECSPWGTDVWRRCGPRCVTALRGCGSGTVVVVNHWAILANGFTTGLYRAPSTAG